MYHFYPFALRDDKNLWRPIGLKERLPVRDIQEVKPFTKGLTSCISLTGNLKVFNFLPLQRVKLLVYLSQAILKCLTSYLYKGLNFLYISHRQS